MDRAAIYIRVSSELQSEKASPAEQESDCREYAESKGYEITDVYRDIERYRVGGRLVEPSGIRIDRPGLLRLVSDARSNKFDVLVAWREDRLYRGLKSLIQVLDLVEEGVIKIELVKENFDPNMAGIKASIAKMEIDAFRERTHLGVKARLKAGKLWGGHLKYGYKRDGDLLITHPEEAMWVRKIFEWFTSGIGAREICRKLIEQGAPQKNISKSNIPWQVSMVYRILNSEMYATGIHKVRRDKEIFELPAPQLIDMKTFEKAKRIKKDRKQYPARNIKYHYLLGGLLTCPCGTKWSAYTRERDQKWTKKTTGEEKTYRAIHSYYRCTRLISSVQKTSTHPDCPRTKGRIRLDKLVWKKVSDVLMDPGILLEATRARREELSKLHKDAAERVKGLNAELESLELQRQAYVRKYGVDCVKGGPFTESDLDQVLEQLSGEEIQIKRRISELEVLADSRVGQLESLVEEYLTDIGSGLEWLNKVPENEQEEDEQFQERRKILKTLVEKVILRKSRPPEMVFKLDLSPLLQIKSQGS